MVKLPPLDKGILPLQKLRDEYERALTHLLDHLGTDRVSLVLTKRLASLLTHVFVDGLGVLKNHHVVECLELSDDISNVTADTTVVYLAFARTRDVRAVAVHAEKLLTQEDGERRKRRLALYVVGKWTTMLSQVMDNGRVKSRFQTGELAMGFFPLDTDLLTLGYQRTLYECEVEGNRSSLVDMAAALNLLQQVYGKFGSIKYKGEMSMLVLNHLMEMHAGGSGMMSGASATQGTPTGTQRSRLDTLILLDRGVDFASVFSTPLTYEAVLDELMHIQDGFITASPQILRADDSASDVPVPVALNSTDDIYRQIRDKHIHTIPAALNVQAVAVKQRFSEFQRVSDTATAAEVNEFVKTVPQMKASQQAIEQHMNLLEYLETTTSGKPFRDLWHLERKIMDQADGVLDTIQDLIFRHEDLRKILRLLCLYCVVNDGMERHNLERLKMHVVRAYGHELILSFRNLERVGVLYERHSSWGLFLDLMIMCARSIKLLTTLIDLDVNIKNPKNAAFVTSGYTPISARLVEEILKHGHWRGIDHAMGHLPGPRAEVHLAENDREKGNNPDATKKVQSKKKTVVVVGFVGTVSLLEGAALRPIALICS
ncbi:LOW QUALITY PROTEIN: Vacuolar protein sorting-associated protein, partial [Phytophthora palmivora]